jgi:RNA-dependent RNA polymerase
MILEDRGVTKESFMALQEIAVANARTIDDSLVQFRQVLKAHSLGGGFRLDFILDQLMKLGLDLKLRNSEQRLDNAFLGRLRHFAMTHVLRDIKHGARIPIPKSWLLVGVADEGPAYASAGYKNVYELPKGKIYGKITLSTLRCKPQPNYFCLVCVQEPDDEKPTWLRGSCTISRSPVVHPGDSRS